MFYQEKETIDAINLEHRGVSMLETDTSMRKTENSTEKNDCASKGTVEMSARSNKSDVTGERQINPRIFRQCKVLQTNTMEADSVFDGTDSSYLNQKYICMLDLSQLSGKILALTQIASLERSL